MTNLIAFGIYRTEELSIGGKRLLVRFLRRKDCQEYKLLVSDEASGEVWMHGYSAETAQDLAKQTGSYLEQYISSILQNDISYDISHT